MSCRLRKKPRAVVLPALDMDRGVAPPRPVHPGAGIGVARQTRPQVVNREIDGLRQISFLWPFVEIRLIVYICLQNNTNMTKELKSSSRFSLSSLTSLFFMWGFITVLNDILIPHLKGVFDLSYLEAMLVQLAFFGAYFIGGFIYFLISMISGDPINRMGYKNGYPGQGYL